MKNNPQEDTKTIIEQAYLEIFGGRDMNDFSPLILFTVQGLSLVKDYGLFQKIAEFCGRRKNGAA